MDKKLDVKKEEKKVRKIIDNLDAVMQLRKKTKKPKIISFISIVLLLLFLVLLSGCQHPYVVSGNRQLPLLPALCAAFFVGFLIGSAFSDEDKNNRDKEE